MTKEKIIFGARVKLKSESNLMKFLGWLLKPFNPFFLTHYWTTLFTTIYAPSYVDLDNEEMLYRYENMIEHEKVHIEDFKKYHILFLLSYLLPYARFVWERRAYIKELDALLEKHDYFAFDRRLEEISSDLGGPRYLWAWRKKSIKKWFEKHFNYPLI